MKILLARVVGGLVGLLSVLGISQWIASESGEVVNLETRSDSGEVKTTPVWIVEHEGSSWLRAERLYVPGTSMTSTRPERSSSSRPTCRSTVVPG